MSRVRHDPRKLEPEINVAMESVFRGHTPYRSRVSFSDVRMAARRHDALCRLAAGELDACLRRYAEVHGFNFGD
jgi:hypothetical protein